MIKVNEKELFELIKNEKVLVKFSAPWCAPCKSYTPTLEKFAEEHKDYLVLDVDIDEDIDVAKKFKVNSLPTTIFFMFGAEKGRKVGALTLSGISDFVSCF